MVFFNSKISPLTLTVICFERSPLATAVVTAAMLRTCDVRLEAIEFTESVKAFHVPETPSTFAWPPRIPSVPTSRARTGQAHARVQLQIRRPRSREGRHWRVHSGRQGNGQQENRPHNSVDHDG